MRTLYKYLTVSAAFLALAGFVILGYFLWALRSVYSIASKGDLILLEKSGQTGDFIGGLVGSLWAFCGVILFFIALLLQRDDLRLQKKELKEQRLQFEINRLTDLIYNQLKRFDETVNSIEFRGAHGYAATERLYSNFAKLNSSNNIAAIVNISCLFRHSIYDFLGANISSIQVIEDLFDNEEINISKRNKLKRIFLINIGASVTLTWHTLRGSMTLVIDYYNENNNLPKTGRDDDLDIERYNWIAEQLDSLINFETNAYSDKQ